MVQSVPFPCGLVRRPGLSQLEGDRGAASGSEEVTSLKSKEESLQRAQMVASSTSPSYCPERTGLSFFKLAAGRGGRKAKRQVEENRDRDAERTWGKWRGTVGDVVTEVEATQAGERTRSGKEEERERKIKLEGGPRGKKWGVLSAGATGS